MEQGLVVERAVRGDETAFRELVVSSHRLVRAICLAYAANSADAEDLVQEVFVRAQHDLPQLRDGDRFLPWLRQVATNTCRMWLRRSPPDPVALEQIPEPADPRAQEALSRSGVNRIVHDVLTRVSHNSREVLALHYLAGCSEAEIAEVLGLARATVKSRLYEGRKQAKRYLLPVVEQFLLLENGSEESVARILEGCGSPGCHCPDTLMERR